MAVPVALVDKFVLMRSVFVVGGRFVDNTGGLFVMSVMVLLLLLEFWPQPAMTIRIKAGTPADKRIFFFILV